MQVGRKLEVTRQGQHGFHTAACNHTDSPGGRQGPGRSLMSTSTTTLWIFELQHINCKFNVKIISRNYGPLLVLPKEIY